MFGLFKRRSEDNNAALHIAMYHAEEQVRQAQAEAYRRAYKDLAARLTQLQEEKRLLEIMLKAVVLRQKDQTIMVPAKTYAMASMSNSWIERYDEGLAIHLTAGNGPKQ